MKFYKSTANNLIVINRCVFTLLRLCIFFGALFGKVFKLNGVILKKVVVQQEGNTLQIADFYQPVKPKAVPFWSLPAHFFT
jgi:hypothetical protein